MTSAPGDGDANGAVRRRPAANENETAGDLYARARIYKHDDRNKIMKTIRIVTLYYKYRGNDIAVLWRTINNRRTICGDMDATLVPATVELRGATDDDLARDIHATDYK